MNIITTMHDQECQTVAKLEKSDLETTFIKLMQNYGP